MFMDCGRCEVCCTEAHMKVDRQWISAGGYWDARGCRWLSIQSVECRYELLHGWGKDVG